MPDDSVLIGILKWVALALALGSTLWGLLAPRPNREEVDGRKRITGSGAVTFAMILAGASVSALSLGLETALKARKDAEAVASQALAERDKARAARDQRLRDALALATRADTRSGLAEVRAGRADTRAEAADARAAAAVRDTREQLRDLALSRNVAKGATDNLERTGQALTQIERVLQPLEAMTVTVDWEIPAEAPPMAAWAARAAEGVRLAESVRKRDWNVRTYRRPPYEPQKIVDLDDDLYPGRGPDERPLATSLEQAYAELLVFAQGTEEAAIRAKLAEQCLDLGKIADLRLEIRPKSRPEASYVVATRALRFVLSGTVETATMERNGGAIVSLADLERSVALIVFRDGYIHGQSRPVEVVIETRSRRYPLPADAMRRIPGCLESAVYFLPPLRPAR